MNRISKIIGWINGSIGPGSWIRGASTCACSIECAHCFRVLRR